MTRPSEKVALITGGASGLGKAMAQRFDAEGTKVVVADVDTKQFTTMNPIPEPIDVADAALFFASDEARFILYYARGAAGGRRLHRTMSLERLVTA